MESNDESRRRAQQILFPAPQLWTDLFSLLLFIALISACLVVQIRYILALRRLPDSFLHMLGHGSSRDGLAILLSASILPVIGIILSMVMARLVWPRWSGLSALAGRFLIGWVGLFGILVVQIWIDGVFWPNLAYAIALLALIGIVDGLRVWRVFGKQSEEESSRRNRGNAPSRVYVVEDKPSIFKVAKSFANFTAAILTWHQRILLPFCISLLTHIVSLPLVLLYLTRHVARYPEIDPKPSLVVDYPTETMVLLLLVYGFILFGLLVHLVLTGGKKALIPEKDIGSIWLYRSKSIGTATFYALLFAAIGIWRTPGPIIVLLVTLIASTSPQLRQLAYAVLFNRDCSPITSPGGYQRNLLTFLPHCFTILNAGLAAILGGSLQIFILRNVFNLTDNVLLEVGAIIILHTWMCMLIPWIPEIASAAMLGGAASELQTFVHNRFPWYAQADLGQQPGF